MSYNDSYRIFMTLFLYIRLFINHDYISIISALTQQIAALPEKEKGMIRVLVEYCNKEK